MIPKKTLPRSLGSLLFMEFLLSGSLATGLRAPWGHLPQMIPPTRGGSVPSRATAQSPWCHPGGQGTVAGGGRWQMVSVHCAVFMLIADIFNVLCYSIHLCERAVL